MELLQLLGGGVDILYINVGLETWNLWGEGGRGVAPCDRPSRYCEVPVESTRSGINWLLGSGASRQGLYPKPRNALDASRLSGAE